MMVVQYTGNESLIFANNVQVINCFQNQKAENLPTNLEVFFFAGTEIKGGLQVFML